MAPEQIEGLPGIDHRADIYSMGVVFYELLTCELPLGRFSPPSERAETDVRLDEVVLRTLAREPDRRYQQASQVKTDVEALRGPSVAVNPFAIPAHRRWIGKGVAGFIAGVLVTPILFTALYFSMEARQRSQATAQFSERERQLADAYVQKEISEAQARQAAQASTDQSSMGGSMGTLDAGSGMMSGAGGGGMPGMSEMTGGMGSAMSSNLFDPGSAIVFENSVPSLNPQLFNLTDEQRAAVNAILKETHERYLKEEALHSIVSVNANGVQATEISEFSDQLRAIENEMWTKLDDVVPVETQKELRNKLNLHNADAVIVDSGPIGMSGSGTKVGMPGMYGPSVRVEGPQQGLFAWDQRFYPLIIQISRSGRWFEWSIQSKISDLARNQKAPTLPSTLQRFYREPGPWMAVANARATYAAKDWMKLANYFTAKAMTREFLNSCVLQEAIEARMEDDGTTVNEWAARYAQRYMEEITRSPELSATMGDAFGKQALGVQSDIDFEKLFIELQGTPLSDVDAAVEQATHAMPKDILKNAFALLRLTLAATDDDEFEFELASGEVSSYTETGDTASATLTIPNKPPVPIRFKRENGQWKIDAIGSNERLLERLKQTKIWKLNSIIDPALKPWPLPAEEPTPPAEKNPVDGATNGVDLRNSKG